MQTYIKFFTCKPICLCFFNWCSSFLTFISFAAINCVFVCQLVDAFKFVDIKKHRPQTIYMRSVSYRVAYGVRSDCVRRPIGLRSESDRVAFGVRSDCVRCPLIFVQLMCSCSFDRMFVFLCSDFIVCELFAQIISRQTLFPDFVTQKTCIL